MDSIILSKITYNKYYEFSICKNILSDYIMEGNLRKNIKISLKNDINKNNILYIYEIIERHVNYPNKDGSIIYIGETEAEQKRFYHIISEKGMDNAHETQSNYSISSYYHNGYKIKLTIFTLDSNSKRDLLEKILTSTHVKEYGALPICSGGGGNYTPKTLNEYK